ncbi:restriction endonuclease subunit S [Methanosarcina mazei]|uniref:Type I restriction modification DNA specificity domain-containing protein n=2 Tax=Methanosarcina mazei TaxID=2209 RepID=A0A0F8S2X6_METMZ|nr:restriction endonuclease subunit S [Methanosarcina mazei]AKB40079.1 Type I restriction-modification system, specificity subunit S [Methanosarcina mazei WWM610]KKH30604.1 hypothetical protein DU37_10820 [Methanosarcina mazei]KKH61201.1 hypothetical protein DU74_07325 [Methanosarcina mazei]
MISNLKNVPPNWQKVRFDEIAEIVTDRIEKPTESGLSDYIGLEHLDTDCIRIKRFGSTEDVDATKFLCKKGDIIFGKRRAYLRKLAVSDREAVVSAHSMVLRPTGDKIYPDFLPCFMQSSIFWKTAHSISEGSMSPTIKWKTLATQEFWLPGIEEQKKISELLWSIEDNIQKTEKLIETTEKLKQGLLNELLTKGIGHTRFKDSELGRIPEEWEVKSISDFCYVKGRIGWKGLKKEEFTEEGPYLITGTDFEDGKINWSTCYRITEERYIESPEISVEAGDILLTKDGTIGKVAIIDYLPDKASLNSHLLLIRPNSNVTSKHLYYVLNSNLFERYVDMKKTGSTRLGLSQKSFENFRIPIPDLQEQRRIVNIIDTVNHQTNSNINNIGKLTNLKKKMANELLSGKIKI